MAATFEMPELHRDARFAIVCRASTVRHFTGFKDMLDVAVVLKPD